MCKEQGSYKPTNYETKVKKTDHNTIILKIKIDKCVKSKPEPYINTNNENDREIFKQLIIEADIDRLFNNMDVDVEIEYDKVMSVWDGAMRKAFKKITPKTKIEKNVSPKIRELIREEKWIRDNIMRIQNEEG